MNSTIAALCMIFSAFLASLSQVLLKTSANKTYDKKIYEFLNVHVIFGYGLLCLTMLINVAAFQYLPFKMGPVLNTLSYVFVFLFSRFLFKETMTSKKVIGVVLIVIGVVVFNL